MKNIVVGGTSLAGTGLLSDSLVLASDFSEKLSIEKEPQMSQTRKFLEQAVLKREYIDRFLDPKAQKWAVFDSELGYTLQNCVLKNGVDGSLTFENFEPAGQRKMINYAKKPCRINSYGDSFTECHQVSDGETWQEILAAHLGEPIRNFGVGGYGVYQAYRRMLRAEATNSSAKYIILNIWNYDHIRNIDKWRWIKVEGYRKAFDKDFQKSTKSGFLTGSLFHANPWAYLRIDAATGNVVEYPNPYPEPQDLYKLCDKEHVYNAFRDDFVVQIIMAQKTGKFDYPEEIAQLCKTMNIKGDLNDSQQCRKIASDLHLKCALRSSMYVVDKAVEFAEKNNKKLMILLSCGRDSVVKAFRGQQRFDQSFVDFLVKKNIPFVDTLEKHVEDFKSFNLSPIDYCKRYYIGHYSPKGNHFFAFAIKDEIVEWLEPKPPAYRTLETT